MSVARGQILSGTTATDGLLPRGQALSTGRERGGFTAEPLFENLARRSALEVGAGVATLSPAAQAGGSEEPFKGGGGGFGGGGGSGTY